MCNSFSASASSRWCASNSMRRSSHSTLAYFLLSRPADGARRPLITSRGGRPLLASCDARVLGALGRLLARWNLRLLRPLVRQALVLAESHPDLRHEAVGSQHMKSEIIAQWGWRFFIALWSRITLGRRPMPCLVERNSPLSPCKVIRLSHSQTLPIAPDTSQELINTMEW